MRSPFTGIVFAFELTHDVNVILPLLVACVIAHAFTSLTLKRSILTEKVARRGYHLSREYAVDPLEIQFGREVMRTHIAVLSPNLSRHDLPASLHNSRRGQVLYPAVGPDGTFLGVVTRKDLQKLASNEMPGEELADVIHKDPVVAYPDEPLRVVVYRMAETGLKISGDR
ncbi:MAG TPA: CBS domain-containing protein [Bryobacteraceae bacterium]|jgi:CIC family chloride channel protein|nr:CBS domain-containing protein [Bryobacteraceae bacterium]